MASCFLAASIYALVFGGLLMISLVVGSMPTKAVIRVNLYDKYVEFTNSQ
ncbi:hypothetical protein [Oenococcus oeni]|nr:hypothetical protein [Oenococcus oeni]